MSFDDVFCFLINNSESGFGEEEINISVNKKFVKKPKASTLKIILPPWGEGESFVTKTLMKRFDKAGHSCLAYFFPKHLLSKNPSNTVVFFNTIRNEIRADIKKYKQKYGFSRIDLVALSLGVVSACLIANKNDDIQGLSFIVPGSCLASSLWDGARTQNLRKHYEQNGIDKEHLKKLWNNLAPKHNIGSMAGKKIFIAISRADKVIPHHYGKELGDLLAGLYPNNTKVVENKHLGHYLTTIKYYFFNKALLDESP